MSDPGSCEALLDSCPGSYEAWYWVLHRSCIDQKSHPVDTWTGLLWTCRGHVYGAKKPFMDLIRSHIDLNMPLNDLKGLSRPKIASYWPEEVSYGPKASYGLKIASYGPDKVSYWPNKASYSPKMASYGPDEVSYGSRKASCGHKQDSYWPEEVLYEPKMASCEPDKGLIWT